MAGVAEITVKIQAQYGINLECIINEKLACCLAELREYARTSSKELKSPVLRFMQVEECLKKHIGKISKFNDNQE